MDIKIVTGKLIQAFQKYKYAVLVLFVGVALLVFSQGDKNKNLYNEPNESDTHTEAVTFEESISSALSCVYGAGKVQVILTVAQGEETVYQTNTDENSGDNSVIRKYNTVTVTDSQRNQVGLVRQINPVVYQGALIICQGADDPAVCLAIKDAVSKLTGLGTNCISVLKMK